MIPLNSNQRLDQVTINIDCFQHRLPSTLSCSHICSKTQVRLESDSQDHTVRILIKKHLLSIFLNICFLLLLPPQVTQLLLSMYITESFLTADGSATVMMTFGVNCACVDFEDGRPPMSTTVPGMNLRCAEKDHIRLKTTNRCSTSRPIKLSLLIYYIGFCFQ